MNARPQKLNAHLYLILNPNDALIASHLDPEAFAAHYQLRSGTGGQGKLIFAELDLSFRDSYLQVEEGLAQLLPHGDGTPKRTKFISCYRTLEHVDLSLITKLYLSSPEGNVLELVRSDEVFDPGDGQLKIVSEICPVSMLVLTAQPLLEFARSVTDPEFEKGAPKLFLTALDVDIDRLLARFERNPFSPGPIACLHLSKLRDAVKELSETEKPMKGLCLNSGIDDMSFKYVRDGFWFVSPTDTIFFPMPEIHEIERVNYRFWRSL